ncbi:Poly(A) polymerase gamma-like protein, partial [Dinothrombium tinctorium]
MASNGDFNVNMKSLQNSDNFRSINPQHQASSSSSQANQVASGYQIKIQMIEVSSAGVNEKAKPEVVKIDASTQLNKDELPDKKGKYAYDPTFLKSLQNHPASMKKPDTLPKLNIIHDLPIPLRHTEPSDRYNRYSNAAVFDFLPYPMNVSSGRNPFGPGHAFSNRWSQSARDGSQQKESIRLPSNESDRKGQSCNSSLEKGSAPSSRGYYFLRGSSIKRESLKKQAESESVPELPTEKFESKSIELIGEFLNNRNLEESVLTLKQFCNEQSFPMFVSNTVNHALELSSHKDQLAVGELLSHLVVNNIFSKEKFYIGLDMILQLADDVVVDVPKFFEYMGNLLSPLFLSLSDVLRKPFFKNALKSCIISGKGGKLLSHILNSASSSTSANEVGSLWKSGNLSLSDFLSPEENEEEFIERNDLKEFFSPVKCSSEIESSTSIDRKSMKLDKFFDKITMKLQQNESTECITVANIDSNAKQQRNPQICGVSSPISILPPKEIDFQSTKKLEEFLQSFDQFESEEEMNHRMQVLSSLNEFVMKWMQNVSLQKKMPPEIAAQMKGKIFTFGSFRLGVHTKGANIDTLLVAPRHIDRTDFFTSFAEQLTALGTCEY